MALWVSDEVWRQVTLVELHTLDKVEIHTERVGLFDGYNTVFANLVDGFGDGLADALICRRDGSNLSDFFLAADLLGLFGNGCDRSLDCCFDTALEAHRVRAGCYIAQAFLHDRLSEHGCGGCAIASDVIGLRGDLFDELGSHILERIFELDFTSDGHAIVCDGRCTELLVENNVTAFWAEGYFDGISELVDARFKTATSCVVEL